MGNDALCSLHCLILMPLSFWRQRASTARPAGFLIWRSGVTEDLFAAIDPQYGIIVSNNKHYKNLSRKKMFRNLSKGLRLQFNCSRKEDVVFEVNVLMEICLKLQ